jgi:hypothetical protein
MPLPTLRKQAAMSRHMSEQLRSTLIVDQTVQYQVVELILICTQMTIRI